MAPKNDKHVMMKASLAKALMDAGVHHMDSGGVVSNVTGALTPTSGFQAGLAPQQYSNYQPNISGSYNAAQSGAGTSANIIGQQQSLANTLLAQSQGQGPNPAQAALNQATGTNVANQAALMAGQRGASANPGLMARQAAMQGANTQQQAVGQAATMQAQQELAAQQELMAQQQAMQGTNLGEQSLESQLYGQSIGGQNAQNTAQIQNTAQANAVNSAQALANAAAQQKTMGGIMGGIGSLVGGPVASLLGGGGSAPAITGGFDAGAAGAAPEASSFAMPTFGSGIAAAAPAALAKGGEIPEHLSHVAKIYHPNFRDFRSGGKIPGKEMVRGDSKKNDVVPIMASAGEVMLPKSVTQAKNAPSKAAEFMKHLQKGKAKKGDVELKEGSGYKKVADSRKNLEDRVTRLEKMCGGGMV